MTDWGYGVDLSLEGNPTTALQGYLNSPPLSGVVTVGGGSITINAAITVPSGVTLFVGRNTTLNFGTRTGGCILLNSGSHVKGATSGQASSSKILANTTSNIIQNVSLGTPISGASVEDILIDNTTKANSGGVGIKFNGNSFLTRNISIFNCDIGLHKNGGWKSSFYDWDIQYCNTGFRSDNLAYEYHVFGGLISHVGTGVYVEGADTPQFLNTAITEFDNYAFNLAGGAQGTAASHARIISCRMENPSNNPRGVAVNVGSVPGGSAPNHFVIAPFIAYATTELVDPSATVCWIDMTSGRLRKLNMTDIDISGSALFNPVPFANLPGIANGKIIAVSDLAGATPSFGSPASGNGSRTGLVVGSGGKWLES